MHDPVAFGAARRPCLAAVAALALPALLAACVHPWPTTPAEAGERQAAAPIAPVVIEETYVSAAQPDDQLDSLAVWPAAQGDALWLVATAKSSHRVVSFDVDSGERLGEFGGPGSEPGRFRRPNGIAIHGDLAFVAERDNRRVQVLRLPGFTPLGSFGDDVLRAPYGLWLRPLGRDGIDVYVTDNEMRGERYDIVPPLDELNRRVWRFRLRLPADGSGPGIDNGLRVEARTHFGETSEDAALRVVESIAGDPEHDRLLIADERMPRSTLREYTLDGRATGRSVPENMFGFEAEGVALWACGPRAGYWVAVDQLSPQTVFHLFARDSLAHVGSFRGLRTAQTDGIALYTAPSRGFPAGALFAVDDDRAIAAFDLRRVAAALSLPATCLAAR